MKKYSIRCLSSSALKIIAMVCMLCDHLWATVIPGNLWLTMIGRLAFPIFAFQVVEGFALTHDFKGYLKRMFLFALITEIPFNLMMGGNWLYPFHQNILFTFCIALILLHWTERVRAKSMIRWVLRVAVSAVLGWLLGILTMVDYNAIGVLTVLLFYVCRHLPFSPLWQLLGMFFIHSEMAGGQFIPVTLGGAEFELSIQSLAVLALIPIWLYNGQPGKHSKTVRRICYAFYPVHILILALIRLYVIN